MTDFRDRLEFTSPLGPEGLAEGRMASGVVDGDSALDWFDVNLKMIAEEAGAPQQRADLRLRDAAGDVVSGGRPKPLRYLLIQPRGGQVEVRIGNESAGVIVAENQTYPLVRLTQAVTFVGGSTVRVEAQW